MSVDRKAMRDVFIEQIYRRMGEDEAIFFLTADFGSPVLDKLRKSFSDRFVNVGIAEQNLVNVATGLAMEGYTVFAYAIAPFITMRAYEQIRSNLAISSHKKEINVNLIGVGAGLSYGVSGPTHHCIEDIAIMRLLPHMTLFSPSDWRSAETFFDYSMDCKGPKYLRFDGKPVHAIYQQNDDLDFRKGFHELVEGEGVCLVSTGYMTHTALEAAGELPGVGVVDMFMLKPFDDELLFATLRKYEYVITMEEALINRGGLDGLVSDLLNRHSSSITLMKRGFDDTYVFDLGDREHLHRLNGMDSSSIVRKIMDCCKGPTSLRSRSFNE